MISNELLFQTVFNDALLPMLLLGTDNDTFTIIAHNEQYSRKINLSGKTIVDVGIKKSLQLTSRLNPADIDLLINGLFTAKSKKITVALPLFRKEHLNLQDNTTKESWRIEIVPVLKFEDEVKFLLVIWYSARNNEGLVDSFPTTEKQLTEELAATNEQIEEGQEELEVVAEQLEAINDDLVQTQENLNKLNDVLEQKVAKHESDLSENIPEVESQRNRLEKFFMQASAGICILDGPDFVFELVNPSFEELFPDRYLFGRTVLEALPEVKGQRMLEILQEVYHTGETFQGNEMLIPLINASDGKIEDRYFNFIYQARFNIDDNIDGILLFAYEVTEMVMVRLEVEENEKRFRLLLDTIPQIAWTNTPDGEVNFYNKQWYDYTGLNFEESKVLGLKTVVHPDDLQYQLEQFNTILASKNSGTFEVRKKGKNGNYKWYLIQMEPIKDEMDQVLLWVGTATDIQDIKLLQQQKDDFINIASHELKTPIAALKTSIQLLERMKQNSSEKMQGLIEFAGKSVDKVSGLVDNLFDTSQLRHGELSLKMHSFNLYDLVTECLLRTFSNKPHSIIIQGNKNIDVNADSKRVEQVLINLVTNAIKYASESKDINVKIEKEDEFAKVSIIDQGPGIPEEKIPYLFDRYYRAEKSSRPGLGLGLFISSQIISKHQGEIGVTSEMGMGSTFWFTLPLVVK